MSARKAHRGLAVPPPRGGQRRRLGLLEAGASVAITGRNEQKNLAIEKELGDSGAVIPLDVRDGEAVQRAVTRIVEHFGHLDVLVNNAGNGIMGSVLEMSRDDWDSVVQTHLTGSFLCSKHAAGAMVKRGEGGKIINIGSMYSVYGAAGIVSYGAGRRESLA